MATKTSKTSFKAKNGGITTPLWNALDRDFQVLYIYTIRCKAGEKKGPYCHKKRTGQMHLLSGKVAISWREFGDEAFKTEILSVNDEFVQCLVLNRMTEYNIDVLEDSILLNICDYPWSEHELGESAPLKG